MGSATVQHIIDRAGTILMDKTNKQWPVADLLLWTTDAVRELCAFYPAACSQTLNVPLVAGTRQQVPTQATAVLEFIRNMGAGGTTPGRAVFEVPRVQLDAVDPTWHTATANSVVSNVVRGGSDNKVFYVYPPQPATAPGQLEVVCAIAPPDLAAVDPLPVDDAWAPTIVNFVLSRAYSTDNEQGGVEIAAAYYNAATAQIKARTGVEASSRAGGA